MQDSDNYQAQSQNGENPYSEINSENLNELGELYLSIPKIIQQSQENNVTFLKELSTMAVHGTLHLLGYNHEVLNEEKIMFSKTSKILENISLKE